MSDKAQGARHKILRSNVHYCLEPQGAPHMCLVSCALFLKSPLPFP